ncbi:unnamed protein product, partial [marine sediment metagenome]
MIFWTYPHFKPKMVQNRVFWAKVTPIFLVFPIIYSNETVFMYIYLILSSYRLIFLLFWVSRDFIVPKAALERIPELKNALMQSLTVPEEAKVEIPEDSIPGFPEDLLEPVDITKQEAEEEKGSFLDPFLMPLLLLSVLTTLFLAYRLRTVSKAKAILSDSDTLNKKYQLLLNMNRNLDKQIEKLTQENSNLHKELEDIHNNLNKSTENIQQQAVKFT